MIIIDKQCVLCGSTEYVLKFSKNGFQIIGCKNCNLVKTKIPDHLDLELIYDESYFQGGKSDGYADYEGSQKVLKKEFSRTLGKVLKVAKTGQNRLLEVGCAYGYFLDLAQKHFKCSGIEISVSAAENAEKICNNIICGIPDMETLNRIGDYDIVVMLDVIEHLPNPSETLKNISNFLPEGGIVLLTTGDFGSMYSKIAGKHWRLITPPQHLTFFSRNTICKLFEKHRFKVIEINRPVKFVPFGLVMYQLLRGYNIKLPESLIKLFHKVSLPINLFDTMRVIAIKL